MNKECVIGTFIEYSNDVDAFVFQVLVEKKLEITGVLRVLGDMMADSDPQRLVVSKIPRGSMSHSIRQTGKLSIQGLTADEADIQSDSDKTAELQAGSISAITLNGANVPVSSGTANTTIDAVSSSQLAGT